MLSIVYNTFAFLFIFYFLLFFDGLCVFFSFFFLCFLSLFSTYCDSCLYSPLSPRIDTFYKVIKREVRNNPFWWRSHIRSKLRCTSPSFYCGYFPRLCVSLSCPLNRSKSSFNGRVRPHPFSSFLLN